MSEASTDLQVTVAAVPETGRGLLERPLQLYLHDFSAGLPRESPWGEVDEQGRFAYPPGLDPYWQEPGRVPLLIRADSKVAGFMLLSRWSALDRPVDWAVSEFFVLRKYRRRGVGRRAAHAAFSRHPGRWEVAVSRYNPDALPFWRSTVRALPAAGLEEHPGDGQRWRGMVLRFAVGPPS